MKGAASGEGGREGKSRCGDVAAGGGGDFGEGG